MARVFLDTNVFLYAVGGDSPYREPCRAVLSAVGAGSIDGVTSSEVLQEILHVRARKMNMRDATRAVRAAAGIVAEVLAVAQEDVLSACVILDTHPQLTARDALHVAVMKGAKIHTLISIDKDFDALKEIKRLGPQEALTLQR